MKFYISLEKDKVYEIIKLENHPIQKNILCLTCKDENDDNFNVDVRNNWVYECDNIHKAKIKLLKIIFNDILDSGIDLDYFIEKLKDI